MATAAHPIRDDESTSSDPNVVKVVLDRQQRALYFSRAPIPWPRDAFATNRTHLPAALRRAAPYRHLCLPGGFLARFPTCRRIPLEELERLEQLRALRHGAPDRRASSLSRPLPPGVDTPADLEQVRALFAERK